VRSFEVIQIWISDPRSLGSWCIKGTDESTLVTYSSVPLMNHDPSDLGSLILIQIIPKEHTLSFVERNISVLPILITLQECLDSYTHMYLSLYDHIDCFHRNLQRCGMTCGSLAHRRPHIQNNNNSILFKCKQTQNTTYM